MNIPNFLQSALWSYDLKALDKEKDRRLIIEQVLNYGNWEQLQWVLKNYSKIEIKEVVSKPRRGIWDKRSLNYWTKFYNIKIPKAIREKAILNIDPYASRDFR